MPSAFRSGYLLHFMKLTSQGGDLVEISPGVAAGAGFGETLSCRRQRLRQSVLRRSDMSLLQTRDNLRNAQSGLRESFFFPGARPGFCFRLRPQAYRFIDPVLQTFALTLSRTAHGGAGCVVEARGVARESLTH